VLEVRTGVDRPGRRHAGSVAGNDLQREETRREFQLSGNTEEAFDEPRLSD
jgi:hypothetical protein